jgi:hypothetical protein
MAKQNPTYNKLKRMARDYGVDKNALFLEQLNIYVGQLEVIEMMKQALADEEDLITTKEYVKGRENILAHPLLKEIPKHSDAANRTASQILDIIIKLGHKKAVGSKLEGLMNE